MDAVLNATPPEKVAPELNDDRYVAICSKLKSKNEHLPEEVFKALETDDFEKAFEILERMRNLDIAFRMTMQRGLRIVEERNKAASEKKAKEERISEEAAFANKVAAASVTPSKGFFSKLFGR